MKKYHWLYIIATILTITSCSKKIPFTSSVRNKLERIGVDIKDLQYYNSNEIILRRQIDSSKVKIASGVVKYENGKYIEEIIFKKNTPGICDAIKDDKRISVSFENGVDNNLTFGDMNASMGKYYVLGSKEWKNYKSETIYNGVKYDIHTPYGVPYLTIKNQKVLKEDKDSRVAKGRKIE